MSTKALKRLQQVREMQTRSTIEVEDQNDDENDYDDQETSANSTKNIFELLTDDHDTKELDEDDMENEESSKQEEKTTNKMKKKKKKKKRKLEISEQQQDEEDDIDASIREVNSLLDDRDRSSNVGANLSDSQKQNVVRSLLAVEHRCLNPDNEVKKLFGSHVIQQEQTQRRQRGRSSRKTWLTKPKENWMVYNKTGLSMKLLESRNGIYYFTFEHSRSYQKIQFEFLDAVESLAPQNIINLVNRYPFHIDTLIQVSEMCRMNEDWGMATEMIERALYVFECSFHPLFSLTQGTSRLDYRRSENRSFYLVLFHHLVFLGRRGCHRTALEFCKLILSLDPEHDPMGIFLMIDFYAIRSEQYDFLVRMYEEWDAHRNLSQLPNFAFSVPLAMFSSHKDCSKRLQAADNMLQQSLIMFPGFLGPLLEKCTILPDNDVAKHEFFSAKSQTSQPEALRQLIQLYIGRSFVCWKNPEVVQWLERNVRTVLERVNAADPVVEDSAVKCRSRYRGTPLNIYRHIVMSDIKEATLVLPPADYVQLTVLSILWSNTNQAGMRSTPILSYDPLPPTDSISSYDRPPKTTRTPETGNPLSVFFRSLLPSYDPQGTPAADPAVDDDDANAAAGAVGGQQEGAELHRGIGALMDVMRDLLNSIRFVPPPVEHGNGRVDGDDNSEDGDDDDDDVNRNGDWN